MDSGVNVNSSSNLTHTHLYPYLIISFIPCLP